MNILFAAAEVAPLVKVGGLADVAGALPPALRRLGHDARIVMPFYRSVLERGAPYNGPIAASFLPIGEREEELRVFTTALGATPVYLLDIPAAFDRPGVYGDGDDDRRFILFCRGVLALMQHLREIEGWLPDVLHANDWHTALLPNYIRTVYSYTFGHVATVYTIHNLAYQGWSDASVRALAGLDDRGESYLNFMARGLIYADMISTVSPTYAREILTPERGEQLDGLLRVRQGDLVGILNGIEWEVFDPATDPHIASNYSVEDISGKAACKAALERECGFPEERRRPLLGTVSRLVAQKGLDLLNETIPWLLAKTDARLVLLGSGEPALERAFAAHARAAPERIGVTLGFDVALAQRIYAGCDGFLMPSRFEPCGLGQMIALRYGTVPIVRATGGLADTVREGTRGNGFRFDGYEAGELAGAIARCLTTCRDTRAWSRLRERGMREDNSWGLRAKEYVELYGRALRARGR